MISLSMFLSAIGISDVFCGGLATGHLSLKRALAVVAGWSLLAGFTYFLIGASLGHALLLSALTFSSTGAWIGLRGAKRHRSALLALGTGMLIAVIGNGLLGAGASLDFAEPYFVELPWYDETKPLGFYFLVASVMLFLGATANGIVRSVLLTASDESALERSQNRLRGGRFIGILERYLIFGLALTGEPTAAALVISAKSIIRFPELSARSQAGNSNGSPNLNEADEITEYFLLGSLTSWMLALAPTALLGAISG